MKLQSLAMSITNLALTANATWPEFTVPNFLVTAEQFVKSTGAETLFLVPVIVEETREGWNRYSTTPGNMDWYKEGLVHDGVIQDPTDFKVFPKKLEQSLIDDDTGVMQYLPLWQTYPTPRSIEAINHNLAEFKTINGLLTHLLDSREPTLSHLFLPCLDEYCPPEAFYGPIIPSTHETANITHKGQPHIMLLQPVTAGLNENESSNEIVAILGGIFQFDSYLENVLYEGYNGVEAVVQNTCHDVAEYELNGANGNMQKYKKHLCQKNVDIIL
jgi:hypothetical protein